MSGRGRVKRVSGEREARRGVLCPEALTGVRDLHRGLRSVGNLPRGPAWQGARDLWCPVLPGSPSLLLPQLGLGTCSTMRAVTHGSEWGVGGPFKPIAVLNPGSASGWFLLLLVCE